MNLKQKINQLNEYLNFVKKAIDNNKRETYALESEKNTLEEIIKQLRQGIYGCEKYDEYTKDKTS